MLSMRKSFLRPWPTKMAPESTRKRSLRYAALCVVRWCGDSAGSRSPGTCHISADISGYSLVTQPSLMVRWCGEPDDVLTTSALTDTLCVIVRGCSLPGPWAFWHASTRPAGGTNWHGVHARETTNVHSVITSEPGPKPLVALLVFVGCCGSPLLSPALALLDSGSASLDINILLISKLKSSAPGRTTW